MRILKFWIICQILAFIFGASLVRAQYPSPNLTHPAYTTGHFARPTSPLLVGQCTWYVYGRIQETGVISTQALLSKKIFLGDASTWLDDAENDAEYSTGSEPIPGAIAVWTNGKGHVAFVERVVNGVAEFTESNATPIKGSYVIVSRDDKDDGYWSVKLRASPSTSGKLLYNLPKFNTFFVVDGPVPGDDYKWYKLRANGYEEGWAALLDIDTGQSATNNFSWSFTRIKLQPSSSSIAMSGSPKAYIYLQSLEQQRIEQEIANLRKFLINQPYMEYLPATSYWGPILKFLRQEYDELHFSALDLRYLSAKSLSNASNSLSQGDIQSAQKYVDQSKKYLKLSLDLARTAWQIWNQNIEITSDFIRSIYEGTKSSVILGVGALFGPKSSLAAEILYLPLDYANDRAMYGEDVAVRNLKDTVLKDILIKVALRTMPVSSLGNMTINEWITKGVNHEIGASRIYSILNEVIDNPNLKAEIMKTLTFVASKLSNEAIERLSENLVKELKEAVSSYLNSVQSQKLAQIGIGPHFQAFPIPDNAISPVTSPARSAANVSTNLSSITAAFSRNITQDEAKAVTLVDGQGASIPVSGFVLNNNTLVFSLSQSLMPDTLYILKNLPDWDNSKYDWTFTTESQELRIGAKVKVSNTGGVGLKLRKDPGLSGQWFKTLSEGTQMTITGGSQVIDGYKWWNITGDAGTGWSAVGDWLSPIDSGGGLHVGAVVTVANTSDKGLNLRRDPGLNGEWLETLSEGTVMSIIGGPFIIDGYAWWNITGDAGTGWSAVAYWLYPADFIGPSLTFSNPQNGKNLILNEAVDITFSAYDDSGTIERVDIAFSYDGGASFSESFSLPGLSTKFTWTPSRTASTGIIKITAYDESGKFVTVSRNITVTVPYTEPVTKLDTPKLFDPGILSPTGNFTVFWSRVSSATSYIIQETIKDKTTEIPVGDTTEIILTNRGNGTYYYKIKAINDINGISSSWGGPVDIIVNITPNIPPETPSSPFPSNNAQDVPVKKVYMYWYGHDPDGGFVSPKYQVLLGTSLNNMTVIRDYGLSNERDNSFTYPGVLNYGTKYYWQIKAKDERGAEIAGQIWSFSTVNALPFATPTFTDESAALLPDHNNNTWGLNAVDVDNDGDTDLVEIRYTGSTADTVSLFLNDGTGHFTLRSNTGFPSSLVGIGASWADYDGDGYLDIIVAFQDHSPILYRNNTNYTFSDVTKSAGLIFITDNPGFLNTCSWADIDYDGDMDLYCSLDQKLFLNNGNGTFTDISAKAGFSVTEPQSANVVTSSVWFDFDNDGDLDLLTTATGGAMYINNGDNTFSKTYPQPYHHMGAAVGDFNNDGYPDIFLASDGSGFWPDGSPAYTPDILYRNNGDGTFTNVIKDSGLPINLTSHFAVTWVDYDNDSWLDLVAERKLYRNMRDGTFTEVTGAVGINVVENYIYGVVYLDANNDGAPDLYFGTLNNNQLYIGQPPMNNWLKVKLVGTSSNRRGLGAQIRVQNGQEFYFRSPATSTGFGSQEAEIQHFGVGKATQLNIRVVWPSGIVDELFDVNVNQTITIIEGSQQDKIAPAAITNLTAFAPTGDTITLSWAAPGDDDWIRRATSYDIRWSYVSITEDNWSSSVQVSTPPLPNAAGSRQHMVVTGFSPNTIYYFALKTKDEADNESLLSNVAQSKTSLGTSLLDFQISFVGMNRIDLSWMLPELLVASYDIRYNATPINTGNFDQATKVPNHPDPGFPGDVQGVSVEGLQPNTAYYFGMKMILSDDTESAISDVISAKTLTPFTNTLANLGRITNLSWRQSLSLQRFMSGDLNGDGMPDLVVSYSKNINGTDYFIIDVHFSINGTFSTTPNVTVMSTSLYFAYEQGLTIADLNNDGADDLIISQYDAQNYAGRIYVYYGGNSMDNIADATINGIESNRLGKSILGGMDINQDGIDDLVVSVTGLNKIYIYFGSSSGINSIPDIELDATMAGQSYFYLAAGDFNGDGKQDILAQYNGNVAFYLNMQSGVSSTPTVLSTGQNIWPPIPVVGDFNNDGFDDVVIRSRNDILIYTGFAGTDWSNRAIAYQMPGIAYGNGLPVVMDINGDGIDDLAIGKKDDRTYYQGVVRIYLGGSQFDTILDKDLAFEGIYDFGEHLLSFGDLNKDGYDDLFVGAVDSGNHTIFAGTDLQPRQDFTPPAAVTDLTAVSELVGEVRLSWTAPGDDGDIGTAALYDFLQTISPDNNFSSWGWAAEPVTNLPLPVLAGTKQELVVSNLIPNATYKFAMRTFDEVGNVSNISNIASVTVMSGYQMVERFSMSSVNTADTPGGYYKYIIRAQNAGDVNGDGIDDLLVSGGYGYGRSRIFKGSFNYDSMADYDIMGSSTNKFSYSYALGDINGDRFNDFYIDGYYPGSSIFNQFEPSGAVSEPLNLLSSGDVNGDGYGDFIGWTMTYPAGEPPLVKVVLFYGGPTFDGTSDLILYDKSDFFQVKALGDFNGDGFDDIAIGTAVTTQVPTSKAQVLIFFGSSIMDANPDLILLPTPNESGTYYNSFGRVIEGIGDLNGDGYSDIVVSAQENGPGVVYVYLGSSSPKQTPSVTLNGLQGGYEFGKYIYNLGDVNVDGYKDFLVGGTNSGNAFYLFLGSSSSSLPPVYMFNASSLDYFNPRETPISEIDFNGDGKSEMIWLGYGNSSTGTVHLFEFVETDRDGDGIPDNLDPFPLSGAPNKLDLINPADLSTNVPVDTTLTWIATDPDNDSLTYTLYLGTSDSLMPVAFSLSAPSFAFSSQPLYYNTYYYWKVVAIDPSGQTSASAVHNFTTEKAPIPVAPTNLSAEVLSNMQIKLSWSDNSKNALGYIIERKTGENGAFVQIAILKADATEYIDIAVTGGANYYYQIKSYNASGSSIYAEQININIIDLNKPVSLITMPSNGAVISDPTVTIKGLASDIGTGIQNVEVSTDGGITWGTASGTNSWSYSWNITVQGIYKIISRAKDIAGNVEVPGEGITLAYGIKGDINGDGEVDLADAVLALQVLSLKNPEGIRLDYAISGVDTDGDNRIGIPDLLYILQKQAEAR